MIHEFMSRFAKRFGCTVDVQSGREFNSIGQRAEQGGSCATCGGCTGQYGDMGLAAQGVILENSVASGLELRWTCPGCGSDVYEEAELLSVHSQAAACLADPLCFKCRLKD